MAKFSIEHEKRGQRVPTTADPRAIAQSPLKRTAQQRIEARALDAFAIPSRADLDVPVRRVDVHVRGHADGVASRIVDDGERQHGADRLQGQPPIDLRAHLLGMRDGRIP